MTITTRRRRGRTTRAAAMVVGEGRERAAAARTTRSPRWCVLIILYLFTHDLSVFNSFSEFCDLDDR